MAKLVLFDFDGTLTRKDSFLEFIKFYHGSLRFWWGMLQLSPWVALFYLKLLPNWKLKQQVLRHFFKGEKLRDFQEKADVFSQQEIPKMLRSGVLDQIRQYQAEGARTCVVSASPENWLQLWCTENKLEVIGTRLKTENGSITGFIEGANCYGPEKVKRIKGSIDLTAYQDIHAYGDSSGDTEMLALATKSHYRHFSD